MTTTDDLQAENAELRRQIEALYEQTAAPCPGSGQPASDIRDPWNRAQCPECGGWFKPKLPTDPDNATVRVHGRNRPKL